MIIGEAFRYEGCLINFLDLATYDQEYVKYLREDALQPKSYLEMTSYGPFNATKYVPTNVVVALTMAANMVL